MKNEISYVLQQYVEAIAIVEFQSSLKTDLSLLIGCRVEALRWINSREPPRYEGITFVYPPENTLPQSVGKPCILKIQWEKASLKLKKPSFKAISNSIKKLWYRIFNKKPSTNLAFILKSSNEIAWLRIPENISVLAEDCTIIVSGPRRSVIQFRNRISKALSSSISSSISSSNL